MFPLTPRAACTLTTTVTGGPGSVLAEKPTAGSATEQTAGSGLALRPELFSLLEQMAGSCGLRMP